MKQLLAQLGREHGAVKGNLLRALGRVVPSHLLDRELQRKLNYVVITASGWRESQPHKLE